MPNRRQFFKTVAGASAGLYLAGRGMGLRGRRFVDLYYPEHELAIARRIQTLGFNPMVVHRDVNR